MHGRYLRKMAASLGGAHWLLACACLAVLATEVCRAQLPAQNGAGLRTDRIDLPTPINQPPDANSQMKAREFRASRRKFDEANSMRIRQIADETAKLLILARDLKDNMDKIGDESVPPSLIREAEVIQMLARDVQARMTVTVGAN